MLSWQLASNSWRAPVRAPRLRGVPPAPAGLKGSAPQLQQTGCSQRQTYRLRKVSVHASVELTSVHPPCQYPMPCFLGSSMNHTSDTEARVEERWVELSWMSCSPALPTEASLKAAKGCAGSKRPRFPSTALLCYAPWCCVHCWLPLLGGLICMAGESCCCAPAKRWQPVWGCRYGMISQASLVVLKSVLLALYMLWSSLSCPPHSQVAGWFSWAHAAYLQHPMLGYSG